MSTRHLIFKNSLLAFPLNSKYAIERKLLMPIITAQINSWISRLDQLEEEFEISGAGGGGGGEGGCINLLPPGGHLAKLAVTGH